MAPVESYRSASGVGGGRSAESHLACPVEGFVASRPSTAAYGGATPFDAGVARPTTCWGHGRFDDVASTKGVGDDSHHRTAPARPPLSLTDLHADEVSQEEAALLGRAAVEAVAAGEYRMTTKSELAEAAELGRAILKAIAAGGGN